MSHVDRQLKLSKALVSYALYKEVKCVEIRLLAVSISTVVSDAYATGSTECLDPITIIYSSRFCH